MNLSRIKHVLEVTTNIAVLVATIMLVAVFVRSYFPPEPTKRVAAAGKLAPDTAIGEVKDLELADTPRTLLMVLSTECKYCIQSTPFYKTLSGMRESLAGRTRIVAIFPQDDQDVKAFLQEHHLEIDFRASVDFEKLGVSATPTLILLDSRRNILNSWLGSLSKGEQGEVAKTISDPSLATPPPHITNIRPTLSLFDESSKPVAIVPEGARENDLRSVLSFFGVDKQGNVFVVGGDKLFKYGAKGEMLAQAQLPDQFHGAFAVDAKGNSYLPNKTDVVIYDSLLNQKKSLALPSVLSDDASVLKMQVDNSNNALYLQVYQSQPLSQVLYRVDLATQKITTVFRLEKPVRFSPTFTAGAFDFTVGPRHVYVSDIYEYKVFVYSLAGKHERTFSRPFSPVPIAAKDGDLTLRKMKIGGLADQDGYLTSYPPILHLNIAENSLLVVWTIQRNAINKQVIDVYDQDFTLVGTDLKYAHPTVSNYIFMNGNIYAPGFGFGADPVATPVSPLEVPSLPIAVKVFRDTLMSTAVQSGAAKPKAGLGG